jgi:multiple sugar transport system substrate-binding protein
MLYFRSDIVSEEDGAKLIAGDYTWADLQAMAEKYMGQVGAKDGFVFQSALYEGLVCNANEFTANWKDIKGGLEAMKAMIDDKTTPDNIMTYTEGETANSFVKGESVFARNWPYMWGMIKSEGTIKTDQVGIAPLPGGSTVGGWLLAINKNSENTEGAFEFIKFLNSEAGQIVMSQAYLPGFNAMLTNEDVVKNNELLSMEGFQNALKTTTARPVSAEYSKVSDALQQAIHGYLSGTGTVEDAVKGVETALAN